MKTGKLEKSTYVTSRSNNSIKIKVGTNIIYERRSVNNGRRGYDDYNYKNLFTKTDYMGWEEANKLVLGRRESDYQGDRNSPFEWYD